jgi:hypothetical protein
MYNTVEIILTSNDEGIIVIDTRGIINDLRFPKGVNHNSVDESLYPNFEVIVDDPNADFHTKQDECYPKILDEAEGTMYFNYTMKTEFPNTDFKITVEYYSNLNDVPSMQ